MAAAVSPAVTADAAQPEQTAPPLRVDAFVSYSRKDAPFVGDLQAYLVAQEKDVWIDLEDIPPTARWEQQIEAGIEAANAFVLVLSPDSVASDVCRRELEHAVARGKRIVPVLYRDVDAADVPAPLPELNWILCRDGDDRGPALAAVVRALETDLEWVQAHTRLLVRAVEWQAGRGDRGFLLHGSDLAAAEQWLTTQTGKEPAPTPLHLAYIRESRRSATRRQRLALGLALVALAVTSVLALAALLQRNAARHATTRAQEEASNALASNANFELSRDPAKSIRLAVQAARLVPTRAAESALRVALAQSRVRLILHADGAQVVDVAVSADGKRIAGAGLDGTARVWDAGSGRVLHRFAGGGPVTNVDFDRTGSLLFVGRSGFAPRAAVFDVRSGRRISVLPTRFGILDAQFGPDGRVVTGSDFLTAVVWDARHGRRLTAVKTADGSVLGVAFSPDGSRFATVSTDRLQVWDARTGHLLAARKLYVYLNSVAYSPDGGAIVVTDDDGAATIVDPRTGAVLRRLTGARERLVRAVFSPNGRFVAAAGEDGTARIWTVDGRSVAVLQHDGPVRDVQFSPDGSFVVTASDDGTAGVWEVSSGVEIATLRGHAERVNRATFTPDGSRVVTASNDGTVRVWDVASSRQGLEPSHDLELKAANAPNATGMPALPSFTPDWHLYAVALGPTTRVVDARSGRTVATLKERGRNATAASFSVDGRFLLTMYEDGGARVWRVDGWVKQALVRGNGVESFGALSPDGGRVVTASYDGASARVWDAEDGRLVAELHGHRKTPLGGLLSVRFSADGMRLATAGADGTARVWDTRTWHQRAILRAGRAEVTDAIFSADGRRIITTSEDGYARLWTADGARVAVLRTNERASAAEIGPSSVAAAFSPDSKLAVTVGADGTARTWDGKSGRALAVLRPIQEPQRTRLPTTRATLPVTTAEFDRSGALLVTAGFDGTARVWDARSGDAIAVYRRTGIPTTGGEDNYARFAPDGKHVLLRTDTSGIELLECTVCGSLNELLDHAVASVRSTPP